MDKSGGLVSKTAVLLTEWSSGGDLVSKTALLLTEWCRGVATALLRGVIAMPLPEQEAQGVSPLPPSKHLVRGRLSTLRPRSLERAGPPQSHSFVGCSGRDVRPSPWLWL